MDGLSAHEDQAAAAPPVEPEAEAQEELYDDDLSDDPAPADDKSDEDYVAEGADREDGSYGDAADAAGGSMSSSVAGDAEDSDSEGTGWGRKRKRKLKVVKQRKVKAKEPEVIRPENNMTRKLRSAGPTPEELEQQRQQQEEQELKQQQREAKAAAKRAAAAAEPGSAPGAAPGAADMQEAGEAPAPAGEGDEEDGGGDEEDEEDDAPMEEELGEPVRDVDEDVAAADLAAVHAMWEFAAVVEFLFKFRGNLQLQTEFSLDTLACALVRSPGPGLLAQLHIELLTGILSNPKTLSPSTWAAHLANRLKHEWQGLAGRPAPPFRPTKGQEAHDYASLPSTQRVLALKSLCDIRLDREDMRIVLEAAASGKAAAAGVAQAAARSSVQPGPSSGPSAAGGRRSTRGAAAAPPAAAGAGRRAGPAQRGGAKDADAIDVESARKESLGMDAAGNTYWLFDLWDASREGATNYGVVLYREHPASVPKPPPAARSGSPGSEDKDKDKDASSSHQGPKGKAKGGKGRKPSAAELERQRLSSYVVPPQLAPGRWEKMADNVVELQEVGSKLKRSAKKQDAELAGKLLELVVPSILERQEQEERWRKARERMSKQLGASWGTEMGRSMRQRKAVNYNLEDYDNQIKDAIRAQNRSREEPESHAAAARGSGAALGATTARGELLRRQKQQQGQQQAGEERHEDGEEAAEEPHEQPGSALPLQQRKRPTPHAQPVETAEATRRTSRALQPRSYNTDAFDQEINDAIRAQNDAGVAPRGTRLAPAAALPALDPGEHREPVAGSAGNQGGGSDEAVEGLGSGEAVRRGQCGGGHVQEDRAVEQGGQAERPWNGAPPSGHAPAALCSGDEQAKRSFEGHHSLQDGAAFQGPPPSTD